MSLVMCSLCPNHCVMQDGERGKCGIRINLDGDIYALTYGKPCAVHVDPIEKKPAYHFLPGTQSFSIATVGCCLECKYCQNWQISQARPENSTPYTLVPERVVEQAIKAKCASIAYTYTEPTVFFEYMIDTAKLARTHNLSNVFVTCGFINKEPLSELTEYLDVANVDLKAFTDDTYVRMSRGHLKPVKDTIQYLYQHDVIVEITNLLVPTFNDNEYEIREMCKWIAGDVSPYVPLHFSRFSPQYKLQHLPPTPLPLMQRAREIAHQEGLHHVYLGNVRVGEGQDTVCPQCKMIVIKREGYFVISNEIRNGACRFCGHKLYGRWA